MDSQDPVGRTHAVGAGARRALRVATTVVVVAVLTIGLSVRSYDHRATGPGTVAGGPAATPSASVQPSVPATSGQPAEVPFVTKMLDELWAGEKVTSQDDPLAGAPIEAVSVKPGVTSPIGRIRIPKLHVDQNIFNGVDDAALLNGPGHWPGTPLPGQKGNAVISGHRGTHTRPFLRVNLLKAGDKVIVTAGDTARVTVRVTVPRRPRPPHRRRRAPRRADRRSSQDVRPAPQRPATGSSGGGPFPGLGSGCGVSRLCVRAVPGRHRRRGRPVRVRR